MQQNVVSVARSLGDAVFASLTSFTQASSCSSQFGSGYQPSHQQKQKSIQALSQVPQPAQKVTPHQSLNFHMLVLSQPLQYGAAGLVLHEALGKKRGQPSGNALICHVLDGLRPALGRKVVQQTRNLDNCNPLRMSNNYTQLFLSKISPSFAMSSCGISSILVFMSTGQSSLTADFVCQNKMAFVSLETCVSLYERALQAGERCFDIQVWSQTPCNLFRLHHSSSPAVKDHAYHKSPDFLIRSYNALAR